MGNIAGLGALEFCPVATLAGKAKAICRYRKQRRTENFTGGLHSMGFVVALVLVAKGENVWGKSKLCELVWVVIAKTTMAKITNFCGSFLLYAWLLSA
jgi:hypothetical protein